MFTSTIFLWLACATSAALGAPALNNSTLFQNGLDAQALNAEFATISAKDACNSGQMACIDGSPALCQFGAWQLQSCSDSRECFALPLVKGSGTAISCTSYANALSLIAATGATGGLTPAGGNSTTVPLPTMTAAAVPSSVQSSGSFLASSTSSLSPAVSFSSIPPIATASGQSNGSQVVTVTVTVSTSSTSTPTVITLPPVTTTLSPAEASQILSSLSANGALTNPSASPPAVTFAIGTSTPTPSSLSTGTQNSALADVSSSPSSPPSPSATLVGLYRRVVLGARVGSGRGRRVLVQW